MVGVYGPRQSDRRQGYSERGRLACDLKLATFATRQRGIFGQVRGALHGQTRLCWASGQGGCQRRVALPQRPPR